MPSEAMAPTLGRLVTLVRGTTYKSELLGLPGPVLLGLASIQRDGGFRGDSLKTYGGESAEKLLLRPGDLYVSLKDVTQSGDLLGAVSRLPKSVPLGRLTQDTVKLVFDENLYPPALLYWTLRTPEYRAYCRERGVGTTNLALSRDDFLAFQLPSVSSVRMELVALLDAIEARIDSLHQISAGLESIAQTLFKSWFLDFDPVRAKAEGREPEGIDTFTADLFASDFSHSELGSIPSGWKVARLGDLLRESTSKIGNRVARVLSAVQTGNLVPSSEQFNKRVHSQDISKYKAVGPLKFAYNPSRINIGSIGLNESNELGAVSPIYIVAEPTSAASAYFVWHLLRTAAVKQWIKNLCSGTVRQSLSFRDFSSIPVVLPPSSLIDHFYELRESLYEPIRHGWVRRNTLVALRDELLSQLVVGKISLHRTQGDLEDALA